MKPAQDPNMDYRTVVQRSYDQIARLYEQERQDAIHPELVLLTDRLPAGARVLDLGCGSGVPIARALAAQYAVTGVDISQEQIRRARQNVPNATFLQGDMMAMMFPAATFDAVVSFYAIFHLPREEHPALLKRIALWLKPGGYLLATVSGVAEDAYTEDDFFGATMYWSNYGLPEYQMLTAQAGFHLLSTAFIGSGFTGKQGEGAEHHPLLFAQRHDAS